MYQNLRTLREVCSLVGVTRSAVQGYEKLGLVKPVTVNKYGHLLYDDEAVEKIALIYFMQKLNFKLKEIREMINLPKKQVINIIHRQILLLKKDVKEYADFLDKSERLISEYKETHIEDEILKLLKKEI